MTTQQPAPAKHLDEHLAAEKKRTENTIATIIHNHAQHPHAHKIARNLMHAGGKRWRALITIATAKIANPQPKHDNHNPDLFTLAACIELIHAATLLHDDVIDAAEQRRGQQSANAQFGNALAVLGGDVLFATSFQNLITLNQNPILERVARAATTMAQGEIKQIDLAQNYPIDHKLNNDKPYLDIIKSKTAELFAAAAQTGAMLVHPNATKQHQNFNQFGKKLGMAFQLADDALDYEHNAKTNKNPGNDFLGGKITLPAILAARAEPKKVHQLCNKKKP